MHARESIEHVQLVERPLSINFDEPTHLRNWISCVDLIVLGNSSLYEVKTTTCDERYDMVSIWLITSKFRGMAVAKHASTGVTWLPAWRQPRGAT